MPKFLRDFRPPKVGMRIYKTLLAALVVILFYDYAWGGRNPCFACIGAVFGMGTVLRDGFRLGFNRFIGTAFGGLMVIPTHFAYHAMPSLKYFWLIFGLFCVIYFNLLCRTGSAIHSASVVFFIVMYNVSQDEYISYTIARTIDTGVGVIVSLLISWIFPSPEEAEEVKNVKEQLMHLFF